MQARLNFWRSLAYRRSASRPPLQIQSSTLKEFLGELGCKERAVVLDLGSTMGANVEYLLGLGMKLYVEDLLQAYTNPAYSTRPDDHRILDSEKFFRENFNHPKGLFDGLVCWDLLSYLDPDFARNWVARLSSMMKPKSLVWGLFQTRRPSGPTALYKYRIVSDSGLLRLPVPGEMRIQKIYRISDISHLFRGYDTRRFYLTKHDLLSVLLQKR